MLRNNYMPQLIIAAATNLFVRHNAILHQIASICVCQSFIAQQTVGDFSSSF